MYEEDTQEVLDTVTVEEPGTNISNNKPSQQLLFRFYKLLCIEILVSTAVLSPFVFLENFRTNAQTNTFLSKGLVFGSILVNMMCLLHTLTIKSHLGYTLLQIMAISISVLLGVVTINHRVLVIVLAYVETLVFMLLLTWFTFLKTVMSRMYLIYMMMCSVAGLLTFLISIVIQILFPSDEQVVRISVVVMSVMFIGYVCSTFLYNTQMILEGNRRIVTHHNHVSAVGPFLICFSLWIIFTSQCLTALMQ